MTEREILLSPADNGDAVAVSSKLFWKRILPKAKINYLGREIDFNDDYLTDLAQSFQEGAYDQVAFMLADSKNTHTLDPERFRGELQAVEKREDGLWSLIKVTGRAAKMLKSNPRLGVSARIVENYERVDGKKYRRALQHVLGTLDPRITGLGDWEEVALSNSGDANVIDLSATSYEELERMATREENVAAVAKAIDSTPEDIEALGLSDEALAEYADALQADETQTESDNTVEAEVSEETEAEDSSEEFDFSDLSEEELAKLISDLETEIAQYEAEEAETEATSEDESEEVSDEATEETEAGAEVEASGSDEAEEESRELVAALSNEDAEDLALADQLDSVESGLGGADIVQDSDLDVDLDSLSDDEIAAFLDSPHGTWNAPEVDGVEAAEEEILEPVALSNEVEEVAPAAAVELSGAEVSQLDLANQRIAELEASQAVIRFDAEKKDLVRRGVPPYLVDLARPVLTATGGAVELSNADGGVTNAAAVVRTLLRETAGFIDLAAERGHSYPLSAADSDALTEEEDARLAQQWGEAAGN